MLALLRKVLPLKGHKSVGMFTKFEAACECGWYSYPHSTRAEAWSEWRSHALDCGGQREPREKAEARHKREMEKVMQRAEGC